MVQTAEIFEFENPVQLYHAAARFFVERAMAAVAKRGVFTVALSGGNSPEPLFVLLAENCRKLLPWEQCHVFWVDERDVPNDSPLSNYGNASRLLLTKLPIPPSQIHPLPTGVPQAAEKYHQLLVDYPQLCRGANSVPCFDLMLLGLGLDGHIASLFPDSPALAERKRLAVSVPPPQTAPAVSRLTLTLPVINAALNPFFIISSREKLSLVNYIIDRRNPVRYPAQLINSVSPMHWFTVR